MRRHAPRAAAAAPASTRSCPSFARPRRRLRCSQSARPAVLCRAVCARQTVWLVRPPACPQRTGALRADPCLPQASAAPTRRSNLPRLEGLEAEDVFVFQLALGKTRAQLSSADVRVFTTQDGGTSTSAELARRRSRAAPRRGKAPPSRSGYCSVGPPSQRSPCCSPPTRTAAATARRAGVPWRAAQRAGLREGQARRPAPSISWRSARFDLGRRGEAQKRRARARRIARRVSVGMCARCKHAT